LIKILHQFNECGLKRYWRNFRRWITKGKKRESCRLKNGRTKNVTNVDELVGLILQKGKTQTHGSTRQIFTISNRWL